LPRNKGYQHVLCSKSVADKQLKIFFSASTLDVSRLGIIASKKNFSRAVDRNRIKRVIREVFRRHAIKSRCLDLVVLVKRTYSYSDKVNLDILFDQIKPNAQISN
jgi:ribonuclease P protein component